MSIFSRIRALLPALFGLGASVASASYVVPWDGGNTATTWNATNAVAVDVGNSHGILLRADGTVASFSSTIYGGGLDVPAGLSGVTAVSAGQFHELALRSDGTIAAWGSNYAGQTVVPIGLHATAISAGYDHNLAVRPDGTVAAWGANGNKQCNVPNNLTGVVKVAAGWNHSLALRSTGTVWAWGDNTYGQSAVPSGTKNVVAIAAGYNYSLALKSDGTVMAWGDNTEGVCNVPAGLSGVVRISAGRVNAVAVKSDGTVVSWGRAALTSPPATLHDVTESAAAKTNSMPWSIGNAFGVLMDPRSIFGGDAANGAVDLGNPAPGGGAMVVLNTTDTLGEKLSIPGSVTVPGGSYRASFSGLSDYFIGGFDQYHGEVQATYNGQTAGSYTEIHGAGLEINVTPSSVVGGSTTVVKAILDMDRPPPTDTQFSISGGQYYRAVGTVTLGPGKTHAEVELQHDIVPDTKEYYVYVGGPNGEEVGVFYSLYLRAMSWGISSPKTTIAKGETVMGRITLSSTVRADSKVTLSRSSYDVTTPTSVTVPAGANFVEFPISGAKVGQTTITAKLVNNNRGPSVTVTVAAPPAIAAVDLPGEVSAQRYFTGIARLSGPAPAGGVVVSLTSLDPGVRTATSVTVPEGATSAEFSIVSNDVETRQTARVKATTGSTSVQSTVTVNPLTIKSLTLSASTVKGGTNVDATVTLNETVGVNTLVTVESQDPTVVVVPSSTTVVKGGNNRVFTVKTKAVTTAKYVRVTVRKNGTSAYRTLKVTP